MLLRDFLPGPEVRDFVQCYRIVHLNFDHFHEIPVKAYPPKPEQCLHFFLYDQFAIQKPDGSLDAQPPVLFAGQRTALVNQYAGRNFIDVQVVFQPAAVFRLTGIPAQELINLHLDASLVFAEDMREVLDRLRHAKGYDALIAVVADFARGLVRQAAGEVRSTDLVSREIRQGWVGGSVDDLAKRACLSMKQFERSFFERVGVNPKTFARIVRLNRAYNLRNRYPDKTWPGIAAAAGYHDYQHLVKDYKAFTGMRPADLHLLEASSPESLLGLSKTLYHLRCRGWD